MKNGTLLAAAAVVCAGAAFADVEINLDMAAKPLKDMSKTGCNQGMGFNAALENVWGAANDDWWFVSNKVESARILKEAGANLLRLQCMNGWFNRRNDPKKPTNPKAAFDFYKANGMKVFLCLEINLNRNPWASVTNNLDIIRWVVTNDYKSCVAGIECGNETYGNPRYPEMAPYWKAVIDEGFRIWGKDIRFDYVRDGETRSVVIAPRGKGQVEGAEMEFPRWGFTAKEINRFDTPELFFAEPDGGVFVSSVAWDGNADNAGFKTRDIIKKIGGEEVKTIPELKAVYDEAMSNLTVRTQIGVDVRSKRGGMAHYILNYRDDPEKEEE